MTTKLQEATRRLRKSLRLSQERLAAKASLTKDYISRIERGKSVNLKWETIEGLSRALGTSPGELVDVTEADNLTRDLDIKEIPLLSGTLSASTFVHSFNDWEGETIGVPLKNIGNKVAWKVAGRSMGPDFKDGSIAIIDNSVQFSDGDYVVAENDHGVTIKQLRVLKNGAVELRPLNPEFPTIHFKGTDDRKLEILGVVVGKYEFFKRKNK